jgi:hypothetical protein
MPSKSISFDGHINDHIRQRIRIYVKGVFLKTILNEAIKSIKTMYCAQRTFRLKIVSRNKCIRAIIEATPGVVRR